MARSRQPRAVDRLEQPASHVEVVAAVAVGALRAVLLDDGTATGLGRAVVQQRHCAVVGGGGSGIGIVRRERLLALRRGELLSTRQVLLRLRWRSGVGSHVGRELARE